MSGDGDPHDVERPGPVVLGVDDGLLRMPVLDEAVGLARRLGRALRVVHVHVGPHATWNGDSGVRAEAYLRRTAPDLPVSRLCAVGDPAERLLAAAGPDAVVVLGDRRPRLGGTAGATTRATVAEAACSVLVVPEYRVPARGAARRGGVVAGVDGGAGDDAVVAAAAAAAGAGPAPLEIVDAAPRRTRGTESLVAGLPVPPTVVAVRPTRLPLAEGLAAAARGASLAVAGLPAVDRATSAGVRLLADPPCPVLLVAAAPVRPTPEAVTAGGQRP